jgi:hypothetical protein
MVVWRGYVLASTVVPVVWSLRPPLVHPAASFAATSVNSFPGMPVCAGTHLITTCILRPPCSLPIKCTISATMYAPDFPVGFQFKARMFYKTDEEPKAEFHFSHVTQRSRYSATRLYLQVDICISRATPWTKGGKRVQGLKCR